MVVAHQGPRPDTRTSVVGGTARPRDRHAAGLGCAVLGSRPPHPFLVGYFREHVRMVVWILSIIRHDIGPGTPPRWGLLLLALWVGVLLGCPRTGPHRAGPPTEGPAAVALLRQQAVQGEREAQYRLGVLALTGEGMPHDTREAVQWLQHAATQGHPEAQRLLGRLSL